MLKNTFCHLPGISARRERMLWAAGAHNWEALLAGAGGLSWSWARNLAARLTESQRQLAEGEPGYFSERLPSREHWRLYPEYCHAAAFLDIETTGLTPGADAITTIALYDGRQVQTFVQGENLADFPAALAPYRLLVTYNGKSFDLPFIERAFGLRMTQAHIDLRYLLHGLGYRGGLKGCERQLGIGREELAGIDGYFAVLLWHEFRRTGNEAARATLLAYNVADTVNLATLMVLAYNLKLAETPFASSHRLPLPAAPAGQPQVARETVLGLRRRLLGY